MHTVSQIIQRRSFYALAPASTAVPLSLVSFFASSVFFAAAICHAGIVARPGEGLPYAGRGFSVAGLGVGAGVALPFVWVSVALVPLVCSLGAGVEDGCGVDAEAAGVPFVLGVCDCACP